MKQLSNQLAQALLHRHVLNLQAENAQMHSLSARPASGGGGGGRPTSQPGPWNYYHFSHPQNGLGLTVPDPHVTAPYYIGPHSARPQKLRNITYRPRNERT